MFSYNTQRSDKNMQIKCHFSLSLFPFPIPSPLKVPTINKFLWWRIFSMECFPPRLGTAFKTTDFNLLKECEPEPRLQFGCTCEMWQWPQNRSLVWMANHPTSSPHWHLSEGIRNQRAFSPPEMVFPEVRYLECVWTAAAPAGCQKLREKTTVSRAVCQSRPFIHTYVNFTKQNKTILA